MKQISLETSHINHTFKMNVFDIPQSQDPPPRSTNPIPRPLSFKNSNKSQKQGKIA